MITKKVTVFVLALFFLSCGQSVSTLPDLKGRKESDIISIYGTPDIENSYTMSDEIVGLEINGNLLTYFPEDSSIHIRDMVWNKTGYKVKVWFHESDSSWQVVDAIKYYDYVTF